MKNDIRSKGPATSGAPRSFDVGRLIFKRLFTFVALLLLSMSIQAGNFFPPDYKIFPFKAGDLLVSQRSDGKFSVNKILKVDRFDLKRGSSINIQGKPFVVSEDDFLLIVSSAYGEAEFSSFAEASAAAQAGKWTVRIGHAPNRTPGAAAGQSLVGHAPVLEAELKGYKQWRHSFERGVAGVF